MYGHVFAIHSISTIVLGIALEIVQGVLYLYNTIVDDR